MNQNTESNKDQADKTYWLDKPGTLRLIIAVLIISCIALFAVDFFYHKHVHYEFEQWYGFYAWYGFLSYCLIVLSAKQMRKLIGRKEDYYESEDCLLYTSDAADE